MQSNTLAPKTKFKKAVRVGRGGRRGKTSGRGTKGQKARAGRKMRPELRDLIKKIPKRRGYGRNRARTVNASVIRSSSVSLVTLARVSEDGTSISPKTLLALGLVHRVKGALPPVKIVGSGTFPHKISVSGCAVSAAARASILAAGGTIK